MEDRFRTTHTSLCPTKDDTPTVINPPGGSTGSLLYNLKDKTVTAALTLRDEWNDLAESASAAMSPRELPVGFTPANQHCPVLSAVIGVATGHEKPITDAPTADYTLGYAGQTLLSCARITSSLYRHRMPTLHSSRHTLSPSHSLRRALSPFHRVTLCRHRTSTPNRVTLCRRHTLTSHHASCYVRAPLNIKCRVGQSYEPTNFSPWYCDSRERPSTSPSTPRPQTG